VAKRGEEKKKVLVSEIRQPGFGVEGVDHLRRTSGRSQKNATTPSVPVNSASNSGGVGVYPREDYA